MQNPLVLFGGALRGQPFFSGLRQKVWYNHTPKQRTPRTTEQITKHMRKRMDFQITHDKGIRRNPCLKGREVLSGPSHGENYAPTLPYHISLLADWAKRIGIDPEKYKDRYTRQGMVRAKYRNYQSLTRKGRR